MKRGWSCASTPGRRLAPSALFSATNGGTRACIVSQSIAVSSSASLPPFRDSCLRSSQTLSFDFGIQNKHRSYSTVSVVANVEALRTSEGSKAVELADSIRGDINVAPDHALYSALITTYAKNGRSLIASQILKEMISKGLPPPSVQDCTEIFKSVTHESDYRLLGKIWDAYQDKQLTGDLEFYKSIMWAAHRVNVPHRALWYFGTAEKTTRAVRWDSSSYAAVMEAFGRVKRKDKIIKWFQRIKNRGHPHDLEVLNGYIGGLAALGESSMALDKIKQMGTGELPAPEVSTFNSYIEGCAWEGHIENAWAGMRVMKNKGLQPTLQTFNSLLKASVKAKRPREADEVLNQMVQAGIKPNVETFHQALSLCTFEKDVNKADALLDALKQQGLSPNSRTYEELIRVSFEYAKALADGSPYSPQTGPVVRKAAAKAEEYYQEMTKQNLPPTPAALRLLITFYIQVDDMEKALYYYAAMKRNGVPLTPEIAKAMAVASYKQIVGKNLL